MAIAIWIVLAVTVIAVTLIANKAQAAAARRTMTRNVSHGDQATLAARHTPAVSALVYS